jgi:hypothetical protein
MKAITIQQPSAWLVAAGYKDIENRVWSTSYRGPLLIHAGKQIEPEYDEFAEEVLRKRRIQIPPKEKVATGGLIGIVELVDCVTHSSSTWFGGPYGFVLRSARLIPFIPYRGQQKFFEVPDSLLDGLLTRPDQVNQRRQ